MKALIFAAGIGTRLRPFTDHHPKSLATVAEKPLLQHVIEHLRDETRVEQMVVNVHHFPDQIREFLVKNNNFGIDIQISDESDCLLDTGGGLFHAWCLLNPAPNEPIILHNADILTDVPMQALIDSHVSSGRDVTMLVQTRQSSRMLYFNSANRLCGWRNLKSGEYRPESFKVVAAFCKALAFGGVHVVQPSIYPILEQYARRQGAVFSTVPFYLDSLDKLNIGGFVPDSEYRWYDIGSPEKLEMAQNNW